MAKFKIADLHAVLSLEKKGFDADLNKARRDLERFSKSASKLGRNLTVGLTLPIIGAGSALFKLGSDAIEAEQLFSVSMGRMADSTRAWSEDLSRRLKVNDYEIREMVGTFNVMFTAMGVGTAASASMSKALTELVQDMASFHNLNPDVMFQKIQSAMSGQVEPLRRLGYVINDTTIKIWALNNGMIKQGEEMTESQKVLARYAVIMQQTAKAQGDLARNLDSPANKVRAMRDQFKKTATDLSIELMPAFEVVLDVLQKTASIISGVVDAYRALPKPIQGAITTTTALAMTIGPLILLFSKLQKAISATSEEYVRLAGAATIANIAQKGSLNIVKIDEDTGEVRRPSSAEVIEEIKNLSGGAKKQIKSVTKETVSWAAALKNVKGTITGVIIGLKDMFIAYLPYLAAGVVVAGLIAIGKQLKDHIDKTRLLKKEIKELSNEELDRAEQLLKKELELKRRELEESKRIRHRTQSAGMGKFAALQQYGHIRPDTDLIEKDIKLLEEQLNKLTGERERREKEKKIQSILDTYNEAEKQIKAEEKVLERVSEKGIELTDKLSIAQDRMNNAWQAFVDLMAIDPSHEKVSKFQAEYKKWKAEVDRLQKEVAKDTARKDRETRLAEIDKQAEAFGDGFNAAAEKASVLRESIINLLKAGVDPASEEIQDLVKQMKQFEDEAEKIANAFDLDKEKSKLLEELENIDAVGKELGTETVDILQSSIAQIEAFINAAFRGGVDPEDIQDIINKYKDLNEELKVQQKSKDLLERADQELTEWQYRELDGLERLIKELEVQATLDKEHAKDLQEKITALKKLKDEQDAYNRGLENQAKAEQLIAQAERELGIEGPSLIEQLRELADAEGISEGTRMELVKLVVALREVELQSKGVGGGIRALINDIKMSDSVLHDFGYDLASSFNELMRDMMRENPFSLLFKKELDDSENYFDAFADRIKTAFDNLIADMLSSFLLQKFMDMISNMGGGGGVSNIVGNFLDSIFGGARASGGPVVPGKAYLVGERGPELLVPGVAGTVIPNHRMTPQVTVQVVNNTGIQTRVKQTQPHFDGQRWVVGVVLDAVNRNIGGMRDVLKGAR
jgi:alkylhydroperoxidase/carboxymuconolactone decarboxylase family protein YurZ